MVKKKTKVKVKEKDKIKDDKKSKSGRASEDSDLAPVRQSRRIAQMKIKEEADRRHLEELALREMKKIHKKKVCCYQCLMNIVCINLIAFKILNTTCASVLTFLIKCMFFIALFMPACTKQPVPIS